MEISIILCTYNPKQATLDRVLECCLNQDTKNEYEIVVVDNNSDPAPAVAAHPRIKVIRESAQGLARARAAGFKKAQGKTIVFVDDDNLIAADYLEQLSALRREYPGVAVWGPGIIDLEYETAPPEWIRKHFGYMFQQKSMSDTRYGKEIGWPDYYPAGSGMAVSRDVLEAYVRTYEAGEITAAGRKGKELTSGEDSQIVWTAVKMGRNAGTSPALKLIHIIPPSRLSLDYLTRLQFHIARSYCAALAEIFPEQKKTLKPLRLTGRIKQFFRVLVQSRFKPLLFYRKYAVSNAWFRGVKNWADKT